MRLKTPTLPRTVVLICFLKSSAEGCAFLRCSPRACASNYVLCRTAYTHRGAKPNKFARSAPVDGCGFTNQQCWLENRAGKHKALSSVIHAAYAAQCNSNNNKRQPAPRSFSARTASNLPLRKHKLQSRLDKKDCTLCLFKQCCRLFSLGGSTALHYLPWHQK